jgi:hypothetical protein
MVVAMGGDHQSRPARHDQFKHRNAADELSPVTGKWFLEETAFFIGVYKPWCLISATFQTQELSTDFN